MPKRTPPAPSPWQGSATKARSGRRRRGSAPKAAKPSVSRPPFTLRFIWRFLPGSWRGRARLAFGLCVAAGFALSLIGITRSGLLDIRKVEVVGATTLNDRMLAERSGLKGQSFLTLNAQGAEARLRAIPLIADVEVGRAFPLGARIRVTEREPWAVWERNGRRYAIDHEGIVLEGIDIPLRAPLIMDARGAETGVIEGRVPADAVKTVAELMKRLPAALGVAPRAFRFEDERGLIVTAADGHTAILGDSSALDYKLSVWKALLRSAERGDLQTEWVDTVDLRFGARPSLVNAVDFSRPASTPTPPPRGAATATPPSLTATATPAPAARATSATAARPNSNPTPSPAAGAAQNGTGIRLETALTPTPAQLGFAAGDVTRLSRSEGGPQ